MNSAESEMSMVNPVLQAEMDMQDEDDALVGSSEVKVCTEQVEGRQRRITATIQLPYSVEQIWQILTDYESLADFIPNLAGSRRIAHPQGGIRIEQIGTESLFRLKFCARVVLDMVEQFPNEIAFQMVEGDFKAFFGAWQLQPIEGQQATNLCYSLTVLPPRTMPISMIERRLKRNLVINLSAIHERARALFSQPE